MSLIISLATIILFTGMVIINDKQAKEVHVLKQENRELDTKITVLTSELKELGE